MNAEAVRARVVATLSPDANVRRAAELELKQAESHPGFTDVLLDVLTAEPDDSVQLSSVIYLKNRTNRGWSRSDHYPDDPLIAEDEKQRFRDRILPILAASRGPVRQQLLQLIQRILHFDFPGRWPSFMDVTLQLLHANDAPSVLAGLQCLLVTCRAYRFKGPEDSSRAEFDKIVEASFPRLQQVCNELVNQESDEAGEMLHIALKAYKHATWIELSSYLRQHDVNIGWCTIFLQTVSKAIPASAMSDDIEERERHHWWKAKKWAYFNLNRLWIRQGNPSSLTTKNDETIRYAKEFESTIAPEVLKHYLQEIEKWVSKTAWLSKACLSYTLVFLDECCRPKSMWSLMQPHLTNLVTHLVFPVLCLSQEDVEKFEDEPEEYLHRKLNFYEEVSAPDVAATNFLVTLTKARRKQTFEILQFVNGVVNEYEQSPDDKKNHIAKEGALRMIATLAPVLLGKKSPVADQIEYFLVRYVFPDFKSPLGYLRARACDTIEKFEQLNFKDQNNLLIIYRHILDCMADTDLPVRVTAALALQPLIRHDAIRISMQQSIPTIMQQLLKLANECDIDALANVMEDFVEVFAAELTPFAVALSEQLRDTYLRIIRELLDKNDARNGDDDFGDYLDDKSITALGVLQTIGTLILTLESTPDVLLHIEAVLMPVIQVTLENKLYDLYNEVFEIIDSCTFAAKSISPTMWQAFELIHATFKSGAELYLEDMLPALDNFVQYGAAQLTQKPEYVQALYGMVQDMFQDQKVGGVDRICACKLAEAMMLSLRGHIDQSVTGFIAMSMIVLSGNDIKVKSYKIHLMEMVINAIYYNPILTIAVLENKGWTNRFFSLWFSNMDHFSRVHDKKLCIVAIVSLLSLSADQIPASVSTGWPRLLQGLTGLFKTLPNALKNREEALKEDFTYDSATYEFDDDDEWADEDTNWNPEEGAEGDQGDARDESTAYLEFLNEEAAKFSQIDGQYKDQLDDSDDELGEDSVLLESPLDKIEPYQLFRNVLLKIQQENPPFYSNLTSNLSADEQSVIQNAIHQAEVNAQAALQMAAQAAQNPQGIPGVPNGGAR
ncbi:ARM repeat-containing protein [Hypoxylon fragiforme]|uniref:ARM repeat-containing protein n=1 Tax=Hypoxylon fragiforme TaxID=63214 RepID=UPI0020C6C7B9|nr:ARM repeat-containing protein [Hypoxylon fragiforme]KAI2605079.1 ARM repeat-containing protein [Hypoxylon fragiforme]